MINAIVTTHDGYGLVATLNSIVAGSKLPARIVVTCDGLSDEVDRIVEHFRTVLPVPLIYVRREHKGRARRSQTRNNGVRALGSLRPEDVLFFLDGHILLGRRHFEVLEELSHYDVVLSGVRLGDKTLSEQIIGRGLVGTARRWACRGSKLYVRSLKISIQKWLRAADRAWGTACAKPWWPSLASGNVAVKYGLFSRVNGFDEGELFDDWSPEDDDLGRRLYAAGASVCNATVRLGGLHLWHASNRQQRMVEVRSELSKYFEGPLEAHYGLRNPRDQKADEVKVDAFCGETLQNAQFAESPL